MTGVGMGNVWLIRHGETEWSALGRHTSITDLDLTVAGVEAARVLESRLGDIDFAQVLSSPRLRATRTAQIAGFSPVLDEDLAEWAYGDYEGLTTSQIRESDPGWTVWSHDSPGGETAAEVEARLDRVVQRCRDVAGDTALFAHGHSLRAFVARWLGLPVADGRFFRLETATVSMLGYERSTPVMLRWNS